MNNNIDPFEEFEFKPITEGLGFHREQKKTTPHVQNKINELIDLKDNEISDSKILFTTPLPKRIQDDIIFEDDTQDILNRSTDVVDEILKNIQNTKKINKDLHETHNQAFSSAVKTPKFEYKKSGVILSAIFLDTMLVVASTLLCLVLLLAVTKVDLLANLKNPDEHGFIYISTFTLLLSVGFIYYSAYRAFLGATPGEWAYDQKIETSPKEGSGLHTFKIILRSLVIIFTGVVFLPFFSWILRKDLVGNLIGLHLVKKSTLQN
ncbi:MAG: RDD family protein [Bdellovibrionales bacterium]|nr:RDD family protein [Bdellovibrionales bacterium]